MAKIIYWNMASGIVKKWDLVVETVNRENPDLFFLAEADVKAGRDLSAFNISGYEIILSNCAKTKGKARLLVLAKINSFEEVELGFNENNEIIALTRGTLTVVGGYRPFKVDENETERLNFERMLRGLESLDYKKRLIIVGDFNIDLGNPTGRFNSDFTEWIDEKGLEALTSGPTRVRKVLESIQSSTIDLVLPNCFNLKVEKEFNSFSDHCILIIAEQSFTHQKRKKKLIEYLDWRRFDKTVANEYLARNLVPSMFIGKPTEEVDYWIRAKVKETYNKFVPSKQLVIRDCDVVSPEIIRLKNFKKRKRKIWNNNQTLENWNEFLRACKQLRKEARRVKRQKIRSKLSKNTKDFWKEVASIMGKKSNGIDELNIEGTRVENKQEMAENFIDFFLKKVDLNVGDYKPKCWRDVCNGLRIVEHDRWVDFSLEEITKAFNRLTSKKSAGMDAIPGFVLKELMQTLLIPVQILFNLIMETKRVPEIWKIARITPVLKKGNPGCVNNYRPVSNLNSLAKLFELCVLSRLECLDLDKLMGRAQHGFRP